MRLLVSPGLLRQGGALHFSPPSLHHAAADLSVMYGVVSRLLAPPLQIYKVVCCETSPPTLKLPKPQLHRLAFMAQESVHSARLKPGSRQQMLASHTPTEVSQTLVQTKWLTGRQHASRC